MNDKTAIRLAELAFMQKLWELIPELRTAPQPPQYLNEKWMKSNEQYVTNLKTLNKT